MNYGELPQYLTAACHNEDAEAYKVADFCNLSHEDQFSTSKFCFEKRRDTNPLSVIWIDLDLLTHILRLE
jgi:hypothetical protein